MKWYERQSLIWPQWITYLYRRRCVSDLSFFVTGRCNSSCAICSYKSMLNQDDEELSVLEIARISKTLGKINLLAMSGGEPFLRDDLAEIVEVFVRQNRTKHVWIPTNGIMVERIIRMVRAILERAGDSHLLITVSLDGPADINDRLRKGSSFDSSIRVIKELQSLRGSMPNLSVKIVTTVDRNNLSHIERLMEYVKGELAVDDHFFQPARKTLENTAVETISGDEWLTVSRRVFEYRRHYLGRHEEILQSLHRYGDMLLSRIMADALDGRQWPLMCVAGSNIGVIEADGSVRLCEMTERIGNLRGYGYDFRRIWGNDDSLKVRRRIRSGECSRECTHGCFLKPSIIKHPLDILTYLAKSPLVKSRP